MAINSTSTWVCDRCGKIDTSPANSLDAPPIFKEAGMYTDRRDPNWFDTRLTFCNECNVTIRKAIDALCNRGSRDEGE